MKQYGKLAKATGFGNIEIRLYQSSGGYYIGTLDNITGEPISRESMEYYPNYKDAKSALDNSTWTQRNHN